MGARRDERRSDQSGVARGRLEESKLARVRGAIHRGQIRDLQPQPPNVPSARLCPSQQLQSGLTDLSLAADRILECLRARHLGSIDVGDPQRHRSGRPPFASQYRLQLT